MKDHKHFNKIWGDLYFQMCWLYRSHYDFTKFSITKEKNTGNNRGNGKQWKIRFGTDIRLLSHCV